MCKSLHYFSSHQKAFAFLFSWGRGRWTPGKEAGTVPSLRSWCGWESRIWAGRWLLCGLRYCFMLCAHAQSRLILWDPTDCSSPSFSVCGMFQARLLEWVAISSSRGSSQPRDPTHISCTADGFFTTAPPGKPCKLTLKYVIVAFRSCRSFF